LLVEVPQLMAKLYSGLYEIVTRGYNMKMRYSMVILM
jgi:hypothetical protein